jgi:3-hydroxybutyryl-CoA dehydrogenase
MTTIKTLRRSNPKSHQDAPIGIVGVGLMGASIAACLLMAGNQVQAVEVDRSRRESAKRRLLVLLRQARREKLLAEQPAKLIDNFIISGEYSILKGSHIVIESTVENVHTKRQVIRKIEEIVSVKTLIASNTSALPVTQLQQGALYPSRILGLHWAEPAHITRFMEIISGAQTGAIAVRHAMDLARRWGKEPSLVRKDVRGFITNRIMYAMLREAFHLVESGVASIADVDRSLRNDLGYWITFAGPFRFMDITGIPAYAAVMRDLFPDLDCSKRVPSLMREVFDSGARGIANARGFYRYTPAQAKKWEKLFLQFSYEVRALAQKYPEDSGDRFA